MRKIYLLLFTVLFTAVSNAQISVTVTGNTNTTPNLQASYSSLAAAITDLNTVTALSGPVTFDLAAGTTESIISQLNITLAGDLANAITFQKSGAGANPLVTRTDAGSNATSATGGLGDAVIRIDGTDNIHFNGLDVSASNQGIEYGYFTSKTATNACQTLSIKNATITMTKGTSAYVIGIHIGNGTTSVSSATGVTVTANSGRTENVTITGNTVQNVHAGIYCRGSSAAGYYDQNFVIGQSGEGNIIRNFGGGTASTTYGVYFIYANNASVGYNTIDNAGGGGTAHASTFYGIFYSTVTGLINGSNNAFTINTTGTSGVQAIYNSNAVTSNTFSNNTFSGNITTTGTTYLIYASSTTPAVNIIGNSISGSLTKGGASGSLYCYYNLGSPTSGVETITTNNFSNITSAGTGSLYGIYTNTATGQNRVCHSNTVSNWTTGSTASVYAIYCLSTTNNEIYNNTVNNISCTASGSMYGIYFTGTNPTVYNNTIHTLTSTSATTFYGMQSGGSGTVNIYKNKIYGLVNNNSASTATNLLSGLAVTTNGTTTNIYNNIIGSLTAPASVSTEAIRGISLTATTTSTTINLSYNTVYLSASSTGANYGTTGVFATANATATTANLVMRNNLIYNSSTAAGTGLTVAYRRSATGFVNYNASSNNNLFYTGTPSAANLIFNDGTNSDQTLAAYKARVAPADAASITENASFLSTTGSSANYLHINPAIPTQIESGATTVAGITDDFDGDTRNATTPDIGADEGTFMLLDLTAPSISYTALSFTCATTDRTLTATITDPSGVPTSGAGLPVLYWKINSGSYNPVTGVSMGGNQYQFTFGAGVVLGDVVSYYIVAQDMAGTPNVGAFPSAGAGSFTANPPAAGTPPTTPSNYSISASMSGTYTVGSGGNYATLTAAVNAYNTSCLTGPVVFSLTDASYAAGETFPIVINSNSYANATNTLTIKPASGVITSISGSSAGVLLKLNGADYVTIDGSNNGSTSRDITISNTNTGTSSGIIWLASTTTPDGATNNTVKNIILTGNAPTTTLSAIMSSGATYGGVAEAANLSNTYQNNLVTAVQYGIALVGPTGNETGNLIVSNTIGSSVAASKIGFRGIAIFQQQGVVVARNTVLGISSANGSSSSPSGGIYVAGTVSGGAITSNLITDIKNTNTGGWASDGISLNSTSPSNSLTVANNFISDVAGYGWGSNNTDNGHGIAVIGTGGGYNIYFNTVSMATDQTVAGNATALFVNTGTGHNIRNNIFINTQTAGATRYAVISTVANTAYTDINYNDYYSTAGTLGYLGSAQNTLANWQAATGKDANSVYYQPTFTSATNLHLVNTAGANWCLNGAGTTIAGITADIDNDTRATTPDLGADEFTATGFVVNNPAAVCSPATVDLTAAAVTAGSTAGLSYTYWTDAAATTALPTPNAVAASGTYYIKASDGTCSMILPVIVTVNISPALYNVTGGGNYCSGGSGLAVGLSGSETGVNYQLYNGASAVGSPVAGTGAVLSFGIQVTAGTYTVVGTNATTSCITTMTGSVTITVNPLPVQFSVTGGGSYCAGGAGVAIGLSGSESGVNYQLYNGASAVGSPVAGSGSAISFGSQTAAGTYTVEAVNPTTTCSSTMTGSATVTVNPVQAISGAVVQPTTCVSADGSINITVSGTSGPYTYNWSTSGGSGLVAGQEDQSGLTVGQYTVIVTDQTTGCTQTEVFNLSGPGGCAVCPTIGALTTNPASVACQNEPVTLTASGLTSMGITYGIEFKASPAPLADPYTGGSVIATVNNTGLTGGGTTAITVVTPPDAGSFYLYAVLTPVPVDPACRPYAGIAVTVNPTPTVDAVSNQVVCNNGATTAVAFTGAVPSTIYNWTNTLASIGLAASGTGNIPSFTATNTTNAPVTATVTVTPSTETIVGGTISQTFNYTGSAQTFTVPAGVTSITIDAYGAEGGTGAAGNSFSGATLGGAGGKGSKASGTLAVTPGQVLNIFVGGGGAIPTGGYNGGGTGGNINSGGGGGASDVRFPGATAGDRILVAAGGGGGGRGGCESTNLINGGAGGDGDNNGANGTDAPTSGGVAGAGGGGTLVAGGAAGVGCGGFLGQPGVAGLATGIGGNGGAGQSCCCFSFGSVPGGGGGGGGYLGGGGGGGGSAGTPGCSGNDKGAGGGGAGGSSYTGGVTAGAVTTGVQSGNGSVVISYNVTTSTTTCTGAPITFTYTVNPTPNAVATPANQTICSANAITTIALTGNVSGTTYNWTRDNTASVTGIAASGSGDISGTLTNTTNAPVTVTFTITPTANGCPGTPITATVLVNPTPNAVATPASQTICSANAITTIALTGNVSGTTYNWTRDNTASVTGIAASGSGDISGTLTNTTNAPVTVTFTITPTANGCPGTPITATVLVNPTPNAVATPASQTICSGNAITIITLSGNVSGTTYSWTRDNTASVTGIAASGSGNISGTLTNTTNAPVTVTFTITPTANGCSGAPITATVVVNPIPNAVATPATQTVCTGTAITTIALTGNVSGTTYNWTRNNTVNVTGIAASGSGNISGMLTNTTTTQQTVTFTITPTANGCTGTPITATVIVNPTPTITCPVNIVRNADAGICGAVVTYPPATATGTPTPTITYSVASGSTFPVGVTTVTATATNACGTVTCTFTVTVVDNQAPTITCPANVVRNTDPGLCTATFAPANPTTADNCTVTLLTWTMSGATTGSSPTTGINNLGSRTFNMGVTTVAYTVKDAAGNTSNCSFTVTINDGQLPTVSAQPANRTVCAGTNATFSVTATNVVTYQWQQWNGTAWVNIAGANSSSYTVSSVTTAMNTNTFRVILNGLCTVVNSNAATLFVNPLPAITLDAAATASIWPNQTTTITATATPAGGTFVWTWNGSPVSGVTGAVLGPISIDRIGDYKVTYTDQNGCVNTSSVISITPAPSDNNLWVYPNPTMGQFNVRYFNQTGEKSTMRIYNAAGQMVFEQALSLGIAYSNTPVNLYHVAAGVYVVKIVASDGKVMAARSVAVYH